MMTVTIRPLAAEDRPSWIALFRDYLAFYQTSIPEDDIELSFARAIDPDYAARFTLVAAPDPTGGERLAGIVNCILHDHNWRPEGVCYLQDLFVAPAFRGQGIGRRLIEAVYAEADARNVPSVYWITQQSNASARLLYDRVGTLTEFIKYTRP
jgi:ribosomal protein S18 acetylase RimI-like enzyme